MRLKSPQVQCSVFGSVLKVNPPLILYLKYYTNRRNSGIMLLDRGKPIFFLGDLMRVLFSHILFLTLLFACSFLITPTSVAADTEVTTESKKKENGNIFSRATDGQIKEAQRYYKKCEKNESLKTKKNCKCAATKFLETRMKLGKDASVNDIIRTNINACLINPKETRISSRTNTSALTKKQMDEAEFIYEMCTTSSDYSRNYDCDCFAAKILDERIKQGPIPSWESLARSFKGQCQNMVEQTGREYSVCMSTPSIAVDLSLIHI